VTCRESGIAASQRLKIKDEVLALDIDNAVSLRLLRYDQQQQADNRRFWAQMLGVEMPDNNDILNESVIGNDPYADHNTQVM
jgi:hypothetical protein